MMRLAVTLLLMAACGGARPNDVSYSYMSGAEPWSEGETATVEARVLDGLGADPRCLRYVRVEVRPAPFPCGGALAAGCSTGPQLYVARGECATASALGHELAHWLLECSDGNSDIEHLHKFIWTGVDGLGAKGCNP